jgi:hypothetical protein
MKSKKPHTRNERYNTKRSTTRNREVLHPWAERLRGDEPPAEYFFQCKSPWLLLPLLRAALLGFTARDYLHCLFPCGAQNIAPIREHCSRKVRNPFPSCFEALLFVFLRRHHAGSPEQLAFELSDGMDMAFAVSGRRGARVGMDPLRSCGDRPISYPTGGREPAAIAVAVVRGQEQDRSARLCAPFHVSSAAMNACPARLRPPRSRSSRRVEPPQRPRIPLHIRRNGSGNAECLCPSLVDQLQRVSPGPTPARQRQHLQRNLTNSSSGSITEERDSRALLNPSNGHGQGKPLTYRSLRGRGTEAANMYKKIVTTAIRSRERRDDPGKAEKYTDPWTADTSEYVK